MIINRHKKSLNNKVNIAIYHNMKKINNIIKSHLKNAPFVITHILLFLHNNFINVLFVIKLIVLNAKRFYLVNVRYKITII